MTRPRRGIFSRSGKQDIAWSHDLDDQFTSARQRPLAVDARGSRVRAVVRAITGQDVAPARGGDPRSAHRPDERYGRRPRDARQIRRRLVQNANVLSDDDGHLGEWDVFRAAVARGGEVPRSTAHRY